MIAALASSTLIMAQELPAPSPAAKLEQRVGLTDIHVEYSRPQMKGRTVFGDLVPYDQVWRTGANKINKITFSSDVQFNKIPVKAGSYSLMTIPSKGKWTVILNRETEMWGVGEYDKSKDVLRTMIKPSSLPNTVETFTIEVENITGKGAHLSIKWENTAVSIPITVEVSKLAEANIKKAIEEDGGNWRVYRNSANYYVNEGKNYKQALEYVNKAIELDPDNWYTYWVKAEVLAGMKNKKEAMEMGKKAIAMGEENAKKNGREFPYGEGLKAEMAEW